MSEDTKNLKEADILEESFKKRILIVDDIELVCQVVSAQLSAAGFAEVSSQTDARKVVEQIGEFQPNLILLDIFMPHISGLELLEAIRSKPEWDNIIVLMLSSAGSEEQYRSMELGAFGFIQKPITAVNLVQTITKKFSLARRLGVG